MLYFIYYIIMNNSINIDDNIIKLKIFINKPIFICWIKKIYMNLKVIMNGHSRKKLISDILKKIIDDLMINYLLFIKFN